jgi:hypothetical protein
VETSKVVLGTNGIKKVLNGFTPSEAVAEYVWNGFDATASIVEITMEVNEIDGIESISIKDNGYGIDYATLETKFKPFYESNKTINRKTEDRNSSFHGKNGVGRLTFFTFAQKAIWSTVFTNGENKYKYSIEISHDNLDGYIASVPEEIEINAEVGTIVNFYGINYNLQPEDIIKHLTIDFAWFLELMKKNEYQLIVNGKILDYSNILKEKEIKTFHYQDIEFEVTYCRWSQKLFREYSRYYYLDSCYREKYKENTTLNNKGDNFYHSVFVSSSIFDNFSFERTNNQMRLDIVGKNRDDEAFRFIKSEMDKLIKEKRNPFIKVDTKKFLGKIEQKQAYPSYDMNNPFDRYKKECLDEMIATIYYIQPSLLGGLNDNQLKTMIKMFAILLESGEIDNFIKIIDSVIEMTKDERDELSSLLEYTSMSNITRTIHMLKDRAQSIENLKKLVFDSSLGAGEINAIQPFIEKNYWLFGEQYHLVSAEEPDFEEALRRFLWILKGEKNSKGSIKIDSEHAKKQMDIFAVRQMKSGKIKNSIVIELKHPKIKLSSKELEQVKKYMATICKEDRFNTPNIEWKFYLVGNSYNDEIVRELENAKIHGEQSIVYKVDQYRIYVKTWSEVITDFEINYEFLMDKLMLEQKKLTENSGKSKEDILKQEEESTAKRPLEIVV